MIAGKTYSNSILYTLNARSSMRYQSNIHNSTGIIGDLGRTMTITNLVFTNPALRDSNDVMKTMDREVRYSTGQTSSQRAVGGDHETQVIMDEVSKHNPPMIFPCRSPPPLPLLTLRRALFLGGGRLTRSFSCLFCGLNAFQLTIIPSTFLFPSPGPPNCNKCILFLAQ